MRYLDFILTFIAFLLCIIILQLGNLKPIESQASSGITDVNLKQIGGCNLYDKIVDVRNR